MPLIRLFLQILDVLLAGHELVPLDLEIIDRICRCYYRLADLQPLETKELYLTVGQQFIEKAKEVARTSGSSSATVKQWEDAFKRAFAELGHRTTGITITVADAEKEAKADAERAALVERQRRNEAMFSGGSS